MEDDDEPENYLESCLAGLVAELPLCEEGSRPAAHEFAEVQCLFRDAPRSGLCSFLIGSIEQEREQVNDDCICNQYAPIITLSELSERIAG